MEYLREPLHDVAELEARVSDDSISAHVLHGISRILRQVADEMISDSEGEAVPARSALLAGVWVETIA
jgi:hypothetical protein